MVTKLADIIEPVVYSAYSIQRTKELFDLYMGGIVQTDGVLDSLASGPGKTFPLPYWNDLSGAPEVQSDTFASTPGNIGAAKDEAVKHFLIKSWGANDLVKHISGDDPMMAIADLTATYWSRQMQSYILIPSLNGIFASALAASHTLNVSIADGNAATDANKIGSDTFVDAVNLLGDGWKAITAVAMHSKPFSRLQKMGLIETRQLQDQTISIDTFLGRRVIVDDGCPRVAGGTSGWVYSTFLFGEGAIAFGDGGPEPDEFVETDRDSLGSTNYLINRRHFILHPRGVAWVGTAASTSPTNIELATGTNWQKRWADKNIPLVRLETNG
jgi:hypothetical protein